MSAVANIAQVLLTLVGFVLLCASSARNEQTIHGRELEPGTRRTLRLAGTAVLLLALAWLVHARGSGVGFTVWCLLLSVASVLVVLTNTYRPGWLGLLLRRGA
ncbi:MULTISPECIES: DUF3325 domain-containing protein [unclassified Rubrivivax]|uniref:DUF3325 domain-containing protein n=1 Tax=unclassified Rubrivivax TaxID=2649762 RepID=UPI001E6021B0|nr:MULTISPECIES: DUF3325 domain-containing protein [unclassified Rubrivivax]MCC9596129.1 DUF3325 domain-containing protein [Rubrivivax sp. JA1055]MCC9647529.1 DUF3325 domain-containing protein [Rubrivivax sp. JA1029]